MGTIISDEKGFIFIHIPKTAGVSVASMLAPYRRNRWLDRKPLRAAINLASVYSGLSVERAFGGRVIPEHAGLNQLCALVPGLDPARYYSFAIVRNPWDRVASAFHYDQHVSRSRYLRPGYWQTRGAGFSDWLAHHAGRRASGRIASQFDMICTPARDGVAITRLVRFEHLADDFGDVARRIGLADGALPRLNVSRNRDYRRLYCDADAALVADIYADDIRAFGYRF
ncbi:MAG: sulfotransferase family 2 domain-containing protein [Paracoccaceae bacterium]